MKKRDSLAVVGWLATNYQTAFTTDLNGKVICSEDGFTNDLWRRVELYLENLGLPYGFVIKVLNDEAGSIYHKHWLDHNYDMTSDYDYITIEFKTGRIGIWCEVDGFIAWLDEYNKEWRLENEEEKAERLKKQAELHNFFDKAIKKFTEEVAKDMRKKNKIKPKKIKVKVITTNVLGTYKRDDKDGKQNKTRHD